MKREQFADVLRVLRESGVRRARFDGESLAEVEFFGAEPEPPASEASSTLPADDAGNVEDYEAALKQLRTRRFGEKGAA